MRRMRRYKKCIKLFANVCHKNSASIFENFFPKLNMIEIEHILKNKKIHILHSLFSAVYIDNM